MNEQWNRLDYIRALEAIKSGGELFGQSVEKMSDVYEIIGKHFGVSIHTAASWRRDNGYGPGKSIREDVMALCKIYNRCLPALGGKTETRPKSGTKTYSCRECGTPFESVGYNVFYCDACRRKKRKQIAHNAYRRTHPVTYTEKKCIICGNKFEGTRFQKCCSEECEKKANLLPQQIRKTDVYNMYLKPGNKDKMEELRRELGFGSMSALLKKALSEYMAGNISVKEKLVEIMEMLE